jgi:hypothetical protein
MGKVFFRKKRTKNLAIFILIFKIKNIAYEIIFQFELKELFYSYILILCENIYQ